MAKNIKYNKDFEHYQPSKFKLKRKKILAIGLLSTTLLSGCNRTMFDTKYGFNQALVLGDDSAIVLDVSKWADYSGEQLQLITDDHFVLLTSSFDTNCFYGDSTKYSIDEVALAAIQNKNELYHLTDQKQQSNFNLDILDTELYYNKAITFH